MTGTKNKWGHDDIPEDLFPAVRRYVHSQIKEMQHDVARSRGHIKRLLGENESMNSSIEGLLLLVNRLRNTVLAMQDEEVEHRRATRDPNPTEPVAPMRPY